MWKSKIKIFDKQNPRSLYAWNYQIVRPVKKKIHWIKISCLKINALIRLVLLHKLIARQSNASDILTTL